MAGIEFALRKRLSIFTTKELSLKRFLKIFGRFILVLLFLIIAFLLFIQTPVGQSWLAKKVTNRLSKDLQTKISIKKVGFSFFDKMNLQGVLIEDRKQDTLLYAGGIQVNITDWFFFKDTIQLKYIGLQDALIKLKRTDSVWNYTFIQDYFFPSTSTSKKKGGIDFDLEKVALKNVVFLQKDEWSGKDMAIKVGELNLDTKASDFTKKVIEVNSLKIVDPVVSFFSYPGKNPAPSVIIDDKETQPVNMDSLLQWNKDGWAIHLQKLTIENGSYQNGKQGVTPASAYFDGKAIAFSKINGEFENLRWRNDTITTRFHLTTVERSGFQVKTLKADLKLQPQGMEFSNLDLRTNNSVLKNYLSFRFHDFKDMSDFVHKVQMNVDFDESSIDSDDIAYFAPALKTWKKQIRISGKVRGTVDDLKFQKLVVQAGGSTYLNGDISLSGLPDINQTFIDFKANSFKTTYADAIRFIPKLRSVSTPDLAKLKYVNFDGNFTGFIRDFVTYGTIQTSLGTITSDLNMKLPLNKEPVYSGTISSANFKLGEFIRSPKLGNISFDGEIKGHGFQMNTLAADIDGTIHEIDYNDYKYKNIIAKGKLSKKSLDGIFSITDPNADMNMKGLIDFSGDTPKFDMVAEVRYANLQALNLVKDKLSFHGKFNLNFAGSNIDNFLGNARITEAALLRDSTRLSFDSLIVSSGYENGIKKLVAQSNEFDASITGDFNIDDLPAAFTLFLSKYYPAYIKEPKSLPGKESFAFDITTRNIEEYIKLINKDLAGFNNSHITGTLNLAENILKLEADVPQFAFKQYVFNNARIKGDGNFDRLVLSGDIDNTVINDSLNLPQTNFLVQAQNDISQVTIKTGANQAINKANLSASVQTFSDGVKVTFDTSTFVVNGKTWSIEKNGELQLRSNTMATGEVVLMESDQLIKIHTEPSPTGKWSDLKVDIKKLNIGDISPLFLKQNRLEGLVSGTINIEDPRGNLKVGVELKTEQLRLDNDSIGEVEANVAYDNKTGELTGKGRNLDPLHKLNFDLNLIMNDLARVKENRISIRPDNYPVKILERFIGNLFSDLQGYLTGNIDILGGGNEMQYVGKAKLHDAGLKVNFTQCYYKIDDTEIELKPTEIDLGTLKLRDRYGKTASVTGKLTHNAFKNMSFDIYAKVDGQPFELLNTSLKDNKTFYGKAKGTGSLALLGAQSDLFMSISAKASEVDSSYITIRADQTRETGIADFLVERKYGREMNDSDLHKAATNITYDVDLNANPLVNIKFILDDLTGDEINGNGEGSLNIKAGTTEPLSMRGRFDIQQGDYTFTFYSFFKKPFILKKNAGNYIQWNGDPLAAKVHLEMQYTAEGVSFAPLGKSLALGTNITNYRGDVYVIATLSDDLFNPKIDLRLEFPQNSIALTDPSLTFSLQQILKNQTEIQKQVSYLIVFNSFANVGTESSSLGGSSIGTALNEFAYSTLSGLFFNEINKQLNSILSKIFKNDDNLTFNVSGSLYNRNLIDQNSKNTFNINQGNFNFTVGRSFFNDRFILTFGSGFDVPLTSNAQYNFQFLPDVAAEWLINKSGTVRATFFYRENLDYLTGGTTGGAGRTKRAGSSIAYRKEFDSLKRIFRKKKQ